MSTLKELRKGLKQRGIGKEDIDIALRLEGYLRALDAILFPYNHAAIHLVTKRSYYEYHAAYVSPRRSGNTNTEETYDIYVRGLYSSLKKGKIRRLWIPQKKRSLLLTMTWEELLISIAAHEVRHRVQDECSIKKFTPKSASLIKDYFLKSVIQFNELEFKERKKIYIREANSKRFIKSRINLKEFDAKTIEGLIAIKIHRKDAYAMREEIVSIIKTPAP